MRPYLLLRYIEVYGLDEFEYLIPRERNQEMVHQVTNLPYFGFKTIKKERTLIKPKKGSNLNLNLDKLAVKEDPPKRIIKRIVKKKKKKKKKQAG